MKIIRTDLTTPNQVSDFEREQIYNALDCCVTHEIMGKIANQFDNHTAGTYAFSRDLQGPVLEMKARGIRVDQRRRQQVIDEFCEVLDTLETNLERLCVEGVGMDEFNWRSPKQVKELFYDHLQIPPITYHGKISTDRKARDRLMLYAIARPFVRHLNHMADIGKKIGVLRAAVDPDGRIRTSYNIAGTTTGRFSSSASEFGTGGNLQNIEESLRSMLIADEGMKFAKFDAKSGESFCVAAIEWNLFLDDTYLNACATGDPHTASAKLCWPELPWTGDLKKDKLIAGQMFYRHHSYRQTTKKVGHALNYNGQPPTIASMVGMPVNIIEQFRPKYFAAYPAHQRWHQAVEDQIYRYGYNISLVGRKRYFMGRRNDPSTLREAIADDPQGSLAKIVNSGMLNVWHARTADLMMQDHDAVTVQYPEAREAEVIPQILKQLEFPIELREGRKLTIPYDCKVGWNKGEFDDNDPDKNPLGLKDWTGHDPRKRPKAQSFFNRPGKL